MSNLARRPARLLLLFWLLASGHATISAAPPPDIEFSRPSGTFVEPFALTLTSSDPRAAIHYTLDGSEPGPATSALYSAPIAITSSVRVRAIATRAAGAAQKSESYIQVTPELARYSSSLPILVVENFGAGKIPGKGFNQMATNIRQVPRQPAVWATFDLARGSSSLLSPPQMMSLIGIRQRGAISTTWPQKPYGVEVVDDQGHERAAAPLGMPAHSDWVLYYPDADSVATEPAGLGALNDPTLLFNTFAWELSVLMGLPAVRFRVVEAFINEDGGPLQLSDRRGVYVIVEKVSRGADRLDFDRLSADGTTGGWLVAMNRMDPQPEQGWPAANGATRPQFFHTAGPNRVLDTQPNELRGPGDDLPGSRNAQFNFDNPGGYKITPPQRAAIEQWFRQFEDVLWDDTRWRDSELGYRKYIDVRNFVDYFILNELTRNGDGLAMSVFLWKGNDGRLRLGPPWDFNWSASYTYADYDGASPRIDDNPRTDLMHQGTDLWYGRLFTDPDFHRLYLQRWRELRRGPMSDASIRGLIDRQAGVITPEKAVLNGMSTPDEWAPRLRQMKEWLTDRADWIDEQYRCPAWSRDEGDGVRCRVAVTAEALRISAPPADCESCVAAAPMNLEASLDRATVTGSELPPERSGPIWQFGAKAQVWKAATPWNPTVAAPTLTQTTEGIRVTLPPDARVGNGNPVGGIYVDVPGWRGGDWSELVVRARGDGVINRIALRYNLREGKGTATAAPNPFQQNGPGQTILGDGQIREYRLKVLFAPDTIQQLGLWFFSSGAGTIEILSAELKPIESDFRDARYALRTIRNRPAVFVHASARVAYRLRVPENGWLGVGLGVVRADTPVHFAVEVQPVDGGPVERVLDATWSDARQWSDRTVSLARYAGKDVVLVFETRADNAEALALWAERTVGGWRPPAGRTPKP